MSNLSEQRTKTITRFKGNAVKVEEAILQAAALYYLSDRELIQYTGYWGGVMLAFYHFIGFFTIMVEIRC
jgi:hypothetical protein